MFPTFRRAQTTGVPANSSLLRAFFGLTVIALLAACASPEPKVAIRSGIGQTANLDAIRPPSGVTYRYSLEADGVQLPVDLRLRSKRRSAKIYDYSGTLNLTLPVPESGNLEEVGDLIAEAFKLDQLNVRLRKNKLLIPVQLRTDNRFRSLSSNLVLTQSQFRPHD